MFPGLTQGYNVYVVDDSHQDETLRTADPQKERKLAKSLIDSHKYKDAVYHISRALIYDISAVDILEKLLERCKDPCKQLIYSTRGETDPYWYERAVFGYIYAKQQKYTEALAELLKSAADKCTVAYFEWVKEWDPEILTESLKQVSIEHLGTVLAAVMKRHKSLNVKDDKLIFRSLKALSDVMFESFKYRRAEMDNFTLYGLASLLRKVGNLIDAMTVGLYMDETHSDWYSCLAIAYLYREMHQVDEALKWYQKCHKFHPEDESVLLDAGDTCLDALRIREAGTWYLKAIRKREVPWAIASMCFIDYMMTGHQDYVAELLNASRRNNLRAADLLGPALALFKPFRVSLLLPDEPMVTSLFTLVLDICKPQTRNRGVFGTWVLITLYPPSPISYVAFDMLKRLITPEISWVSNLVLEKSILNEDSRPVYENFRGDAKWFDKDFLLWKFTKTSIQPKLPPPEEEFLRELGPFYSAIITSAFNTDIWYNKTGFIAKKLPSTRATIKKLLGIMCHPFMPKLEAVLTDAKAREGLIFELLTWILKIQIVTAMILVQLEYDPNPENSSNNNHFNTNTSNTMINGDANDINGEHNNNSYSIERISNIDENNINMNGLNHNIVTAEQKDEIEEPPKKKRKITKVVKEAEISSSRDWDELKMKLFHTLLMGPVDWSVIAAIVGLTRLSRTENFPLDLRRLIPEWFKLRERETPEGPHICYRDALLAHYVLLPEVDTLEKCATNIKRCYLQEECQNTFKLRSPYADALMDERIQISTAVEEFRKKHMTTQ